MEKRNQFKTAPLPFQGQKRRFTGSFAQALNQLKKEQQIDVVVDLFGGSGLLSHTAKHILPHARVIYNDFDNYSQRLLNIDKTNLLLSNIRNQVQDYPPCKLLPADVKASILNLIQNEALKEYVDYITLSSSLMFSGKYITDIQGFEKESFYQNVKMTDYTFSAEDYLYGLEITHCDYRELFQQFKDQPNVLFIIDPPYLSTDTTTYKSDKYWKLRDYLDVLNVLSGTNYFFFTSDKSSLIELCEWFSENRTLGNPFENSVLNTRNVTINKTAKYTDIMLYKFIK